MTLLKSLATISVPEATQLLIKPFDRGCLGNIEKAIIAANLGYNPSNDGETIRIVIPALTEERRKELTKTRLKPWLRKLKYLLEILDMKLMKR